MIGSWFIRRNDRFTIPARGPRSGARRGWRFRIGLAAGGLLALAAAPAWGQGDVRSTTNYYRVSGATLREIRQSLNQRRPWRDRAQVDAMTVWTVTWKYGLVTTALGCRAENFQIHTVITTTLPLYGSSTNVSPEVKGRWAGYFQALAAHEARHAGIASRAAAEVQSRLAGVGERASCAALQAELNALGESVLARHRAEEREMDRTSHHGAVDGARFP